LNIRGSIGGPAHVLQGGSRRSLAQHVQAVMGEFGDTIAETLETLVREPTAEAFLRTEEALQRTLATVGAHVLGGIVAWLHGESDFTSSAVTRARQAEARELRHRGRKETVVHFLGGVRLRFATPYLSEHRAGRPGRARKVGRRGEAGGGCFPVLEALGIHRQATPALASEVARQSVRCCSFEEASRALEERGVHLDAKGVRSLALSVGEEAVRLRELRKEAAAQGQCFTEEFAGQRVVVSIDGGRLRMREGGRRGRRGKRGRRRYRTPWREPKLVTAYLIDEDGHKRRSAKPLLDATMGDADAAFGVLIAELLLRGAARAKELVVVADGASWIWDRADAIGHALGLPPEKVVLVADFYHAVEHLSAIAELMVGWTDKRKKNWLRRMRRRLKAGHLDKVLEGARALRRRGNARRLTTELAYFEQRRHLMRYDEFKRRRVPLGSGAVESGVRRVVNLRLKGPAIFWREPSAEAMLHLRAYLKAGRWDELVTRVLHRSADGRPRRPMQRAA
jgi:hypothetical protein